MVDSTPIGVKSKMTDSNETDTLKCPDHPRYRALREPASGCVLCWAIFQNQTAVERRLANQLRLACKRIDPELKPRKG